MANQQPGQTATELIAAQAMMNLADAPPAQAHDAVQAAIVRTLRKVWVPARTQVIGVNRQRKLMIGIIGASGSGKSHLGRQLLLDPAYGPEEVLFLMAEESTATYGMDGIKVRALAGFADASAVIDELVEAARSEERLPKIIFVDSFSSLSARDHLGFEDSPVLSKQGNRDPLAEYGALGKAGLKWLMKARNECPIDIVVTVRSFEGIFAPQPELAVQGKVLPKEFVGNTDVCLHLKSEGSSFDVEQYPNPPEATHRRYGRDQGGKLDGTLVNRYFYTQTSGEVQAKGHHALANKEPADLPRVIAKIRGIK